MRLVAVALAIMMFTVGCDNSVIALNRRGIERGKAGDIDGAINLFSKAAEKEPAYAETYNNLGFAFYRKGDWVRAAEYFKKASDLEPAYALARQNYETIMKEMDRIRNAGSAQPTPATAATAVTTATATVGTVMAQPTASLGNALTTATDAVKTSKNAVEKK